MNVNEEKIIWQKVLNEAKKGSFTYVFYVWEQVEHLTKKIVLAKGTHPQMQTKIVATGLDAYQFEDLVNDFNTQRR